MKLVQIDFGFEGPFGDGLAESRAEMAQIIAGEPGLRWKIWTENADTGQAGGIYLFEDEDSARAYVEKHSDRLNTPAYKDVRIRIFDINENLSAVTRAPL